MAKKRVLVDIERLKYPNSGLGFFCHCLQRGLQEAGEDMAIHFYKFLDKGEDSSDKIICRNWHRLFNLTAWHYDVLHVTHQRQKYFSNAPHRGKRVLTLHDLNFLFEQLSPRRYARALRRVKRNLELADVVVCISDFVRQNLLDNLHLFKLKQGVEIIVIHNGLIFSHEVGTLPSDLSIKTGDKLLLNIGTLHHKKQQLRLVEMLALLPQEYHLVLVSSDGEEEYRNLVLTRIKTLGLEQRVHLVSNISNLEKQTLLAHCVAYVHPSIAEGFGIPPIEAMSFGRPTFLSTHTSLPEIGGEEAYYFEELEAEAMAKTLLAGLEQYASDPDKPKRLKDWAHQYDYKKMAGAYLDLYRKLATN
ncbi:MAG: glycosyltransferase family 1 protein [Porphyromonadaceae bacterium]|nr:glycosyltransferase family 1 protein [Porphyromonadaceae bacterium]